MVVRLLVFTILLIAQSVFASNSGVTYQGRILRPDGSPLAGASTQFKLQLRTPDSQLCLLYEEIQTQDLSKTNGAFSLTLNDGSGVRTDSTGFTLDRIFSNRGIFSLNPLTCDPPGTGVFTPDSSDGRVITLLFKDETMTAWEPVPPLKINFVPYAFEAKQVQGFTADSLLRVVNASGDPITGLAPLSNAEYTALLDIASGNSTIYAKAGQLSGVTMPTMSSGQVLGWNGSTWTSQDAVPAASVTLGKLSNDSVDSTKIVDGSITTTDLSSSISINTSGVLSASAVGIGTATPATKLDVYGSGVFRGPTVGGIDGELFYDTTTHSYQFYNAGAAAWQSLAAGNITYNGTAWGLTGSNVYYTAGNVGIGTTVPTSALGLGGNTARKIAMERHTTANSAGNSLTVVSGAATTGATDKNGGSLILSSGTATGTGSSSIFFQTAKAQATTASTDNAPATRMTIAGSGNVGVGNASPLAPLQVLGTVSGASIGSFNLNSTLGSGGGYYGMNAYYDGTDLRTANDTVHNGGGIIYSTIFGGLNFASISNTGGTNQTIPLGTLKNMVAFAVSASGVSAKSISTAATTLAISNNDTGGKSYVFYSTGSAHAAGAGQLLLRNSTDNVDILTASPAGNVGIGTTSPVATLDVNGFARLKINSSAPVACSATNAGSLAMTSKSTLCACSATSAVWVSTTDGTTLCAW